MGVAAGILWGDNAVWELRPASCGEITLFRLLQRDVISPKDGRGWR